MGVRENLSRDNTALILIKVVLILIVRNYSHLEFSTQELLTEVLLLKQMNLVPVVRVETSRRIP